LLRLPVALANSVCCDCDCERRLDLSDDPIGISPPLQERRSSPEGSCPSPDLSQIQRRSRGVVYDPPVREGGGETGRHLLVIGEGKVHGAATDNRVVAQFLIGG